MKMTFAKVAVVASCFVLCFALAACGGDTKAKDPVKLQVFAANSLEKAMPEVQALYSKDNNVTFADTQFKASGDLVAELEGGAPCDILITASTATMDKAEKSAKVDKNTRTDMFVNDLVVVGNSMDKKVTVDSSADLATILKSPEVTSIAIGDPNVVPAGKYALQSVEAAGLVTYTTNTEGVIESIQWDPSIANKMNAGADKVGTVASYVSKGQCDIGFVYTSDVYRYDGIESLYTVPSDMHKKILYPGAVCTDSENAKAAEDFIKFCLTDKGALEIWQKYGFELAQ